MASGSLSIVHRVVVLVLWLEAVAPGVERDLLQLFDGVSPPRNSFFLRSEIFDLLPCLSLAILADLNTFLFLAMISTPSSTVLYRSFWALCYLPSAWWCVPSNEFGPWTAWWFPPPWGWSTGFIATPLTVG